MNLLKAIEILELELKQNACEPGGDFENALKLGIKALRRIFQGRQGYNQTIVSSLPGETKE